MAKNDDYIADADCAKSVMSLISKMAALPDAIESLKAWGAEQLVMTCMTANGKDPVRELSCVDRICWHGAASVTLVYRLECTERLPSDERAGDDSLVFKF